eukprot:308947-Chlamydomonas_euryale.AAC.1
MHTHSTSQHKARGRRAVQCLHHHSHNHASQCTVGVLSGVEVCSGQRKTDSGMGDCRPDGGVRSVEPGAWSQKGAAELCVGTRQ